MRVTKPGVAMPIARIQNGKPNPIFIAGIKYESLFDACYNNFISSYPALYRALKKSGGEPCKIKRNIVVLEAWVLKRVQLLKVGA